MDPREASSIQNRQTPPPPPHHQQHGVMMMPPPRQQTQPFGFAHHFPNSNVFMMGAAGVPNSGNPNLISNPNFSFAPLTAVPHLFDSGLVAHQHQPPHQNLQAQTPPQPQQRSESPAPGVSTAVTATVTDTVGSEQTNKKRGRPRKYSPTCEGKRITLGLASNSQPVDGAGGENEVHEGKEVEGSRQKKQRGRPPGSGKKQSDSSGAASGAGVAFHMVVIPEGEV